MTVKKLGQKVARRSFRCSTKAAALALWFEFKDARMSNDKAPFVWDDPFLLQDQFSEEERMIQSSARDYAQDKLLSRVRDAFRHEVFDREIMNEFGAMGMLGATLP
jgi:alkylation response protein AidB-like acyl-CoA dehydrogenase